MPIKATHFFWEDLKHVITSIADMFSEERREKLQMRSSGPGRSLMMGLVKRNPDIKLGRASAQEEIRHRACNTDALTKHIASLEASIKKHNISPSHILAGCIPPVCTQLHPNWLYGSVGKDVKGVQLPSLKVTYH